MKSYIKAAFFVLHGSFLDEKTRSNAIQVKTRLHIRSESLKAIVYYPRGYARNKKSCGTILAIHGMTPRGNSDPRMDSVCSAFAWCGYFVVAPLYPDIAEFKISYRTVEQIAETIKLIANDHVLCPDRKVSLFSASFSAGMAIIASSMPATADMVRSICLVGTYGSAETAIEHMIIRQDSDEYGRLIILHNFIRHAPGFGDDAVTAIREAILDDGLKRKRPRFQQSLAGLNKTTREKVTQLLSDPINRTWNWKKFISKSEDVRVLIDKLSVTGHIEGLKARVAFIHGAGDSVIPASESETLHRLMRTYRMPSRLVITSLISHGDVKIGVLQFIELLNLIGIFSFFFKSTKLKVRKHAFAC